MGMSVLLLIFGMGVIFRSVYRQGSSKTVYSEVLREKLGPLEAQSRKAVIIKSVREQLELVDYIYCFSSKSVRVEHGEA